MSKNLHKASILAVAIGSLTFVSPAFAQTAASAQAADSDSNSPLGEIVVTAQRREQRADDVGVSINVLTGEDLKTTGTKSIVELSAITPNEIGRAHV